MYLRNAMQMYGKKHVEKDFINKTRPVSYLTRGNKAIFFFFQVLRYVYIMSMTLEYRHSAPSNLVLRVRVAIVIHD